jgi:four helix bundle protein
VKLKPWLVAGVFLYGFLRNYLSNLYRDHDTVGVNPKSEYRNAKQIQMTEIQSIKQYDLEERTYKFAQEVRLLLKVVPKNTSNTQDCLQLARSSGSVPANYIEANESLSKKDFIMRIKICRKESKESILWLKLVDTYGDTNLDKERVKLIQEATELMKIFGSILRKSE